MVDAHIVMTYPGWRGDNLVTNATFPYGMQWMFPCKCLKSKEIESWKVHEAVRNTTRRTLLTYHLAGGGHPVTANRTKWPITGGAIAFQPGWFQGHATAFLYVNLGFGTDGPGGGPWNMSFPMVPVMQLVGPSKNPYPGTVCLPQVPLPANATVKVGDNATIQIIETAIHGAALYSVSCLFCSLLHSASVFPNAQLDA